MATHRNGRATFWWIALVAVVGVGAWVPRTAAQEQPVDGLDVVQLRPNFYLIAGAGGNIVMQTGPVGVILVDSGSVQMSEKILATIRRLTPLPIRYIINTSATRRKVLSLRVIPRSRFAPDGHVLDFLTLRIRASRGFRS